MKKTKTYYPLAPNGIFDVNPTVFARNVVTLLESINFMIPKDNPHFDKVKHMLNLDNPIKKEIK